MTFQALLVVSVFIGGIVAVVFGEWLKNIIFKPKIDIQFEMKHPYAIQTKWSPKYDAYLFQFSLINNSKFVTARNYRPMITAIWHKDKAGQLIKDPDFQPVHIMLEDEKPFDISPGMKIYINFGRILEVDGQKEFDRNLSGDINKPQFRICYGPSIPRWMSSHVERGTHHFLVEIYFDNRSPVNRLFEVIWSGNWEAEYSSMIKEIVIKKVK